MTQKKKTIHLRSKRTHEFNSDVTLDNVTYHVQTEDMGLKTSKVITNIFSEGKILVTKKSDYSHLKKTKNFEKGLSYLMERQHKSAIDNFISLKMKSQKTKSEYFDEVQNLLRKGRTKTAMNKLRHALEKFPMDPFLLSYYGCLVAVVEKKPAEGVEICIDAINRLDNSMPFGSEFFYPVFYLNLGRAHIRDNNKKDAVNAFNQGLRFDPENHDILWELRKLGTRKKAPVPFLKRGNPINKYIGKILSKVPR
jgi:tetratricopeptide (TPR) repeat protein